ncbi:MAG TPA: cache domain-containing protein [Candidatus Omnitrophota bacterium]|nr:cache domain-containing protein [Candidatus Omnitrophota bacterium]
MSGYGFFVVKRYIFKEARQTLEQNLNTVRNVYKERMNQMRIAFNIVNPDSDLNAVKNELSLDYFGVVNAAQQATSSSEVVQEAFLTGQPVVASRIMRKEELERIRPGMIVPMASALIASPAEQAQLQDALSMEFARPILGPDGRVEKVLYGGEIVNNNFNFIDHIVNVVFEPKAYDGKPYGIITIFQNDVRIATNVLDKGGERAVGTKISKDVYNKIVEQRGSWLGRTFVVTDWYIAACEPILNVRGEIIGGLYVGILEKPFQLLGEKLFLGLLMIIMMGVIPTLIFAYFLANSLVRQLTQMVRTTVKIAQGELESKIDTTGLSVHEMKELGESINYMSEKLVEREESLEETHKRLEVMNKRYLDLIGFVAHELKGILSSIVLNTYLLQKKILGDINPKQESVLKSMGRNLDYLTVTVKNFLNLSRIEKDELKVDKQEIFLKEHLLDPAIESFQQQAEEKNIMISNTVDARLSVRVDSGLMQIVVNNLLSNAVKYGLEGGKIRITAKNQEDMLEVEVYNDGEPIASIDMDKLFKKFSRVLYRGQESVKGTGIGLFISKEIIERHGGHIWVEPALKGNSFKFQIPRSN